MQTENRVGSYRVESLGPVYRIGTFPITLLLPLMEAIVKHMTADLDMD